MSKNPQTIKAWRTQVGDAFADNRFFNAPPSANLRWKPLIQALMASDKERLVELTGKRVKALLSRQISDPRCTTARISTAASANIFTNRELESLSRALSLRRLTYVLFTGDKDRYLTQLPLIQEKLVDLLRSPVGDMVHAEVSCNYGRTFRSLLIPAPARCICACVYSSAELETSISLAFGLSFSQSLWVMTSDDRRTVSDSLPCTATPIRVTGGLHCTRQIRAPPACLVSVQVFGPHARPADRRLPDVCMPSDAVLLFEF